MGADPAYAGPTNSRGEAAMRQVLAMNSSELERAQEIGSGIAPAWREQRRQAQNAFQEDAKLPKRKLHNAANDATACMKVARTGIDNEWGVEGRYSLVNTCGFPVDASWCANVRECTTGRGNLWTIPASGSYPIFFADKTSPMIQVGACKVASQRTPWPSDSAINRAGGVNERHADPQPDHGVTKPPGHICE